MDKYGEFYGRDRISELFGMDKVVLDFSDVREKKKLKKDSFLSVVWVFFLFFFIGLGWKKRKLIYFWICSCIGFFCFSVRGRERWEK